MSSLDGKVALITGANSGIGEAVALQMAEKGVKIALCGRNNDRLKSVTEKCKKVSGHADRFIAISGDLNRSEVRKKLVEETVKRFGQLDILVPNAGVFASNGTLEKETEANFDLLFNTNVKSVYFLVQQAVSELEKTKGNIVVISSVASQISASSTAVYCASKAALDHLVSCLCLELGKKDVRINTVNPSFVPGTKFFHGLVPDGADKEEGARQFLEAKGRFHPLKGRCVTVEEVARAVLFLANEEEAGFITGHHLCVEGGATRNYTILPA